MLSRFVGSWQVHLFFIVLSQGICLDVTVPSSVGSYENVENDQWPSRTMATSICS